MQQLHEQAVLFECQRSPHDRGGRNVRTPLFVATTFTEIYERVLAAAINSTVVAGENPTVGSTVWLPAESVAPGR